MLRASASLLLLLPAAAAIRDGNRVSIPDASGGTIIEFASPVSLQYTRWFGSTRPILGPPLTLTSQPLTLEDGPQVRISSTFLTVTISTSGAIDVRTKSGREVVAMPQPATPPGFQLTAEPAEQYFGLGDITAPKLDLRGRLISSTRPFLLSSRGYGIYIPAAPATFDLANKNPGRIAIETDHPTFQLYYGPNPKEILEQHALTTHRQTNLADATLSNRDSRNFPSEIERITITEANYCDAPRILNQLSLSGVLFPAINLAPIAAHDESLRLLPFLYDEKPHPDLERLRDPWQHYLVAYLREAHDRGLPFIRPLLIQFPKDQGLETRSDLYMIGDEILVAPGCNVTEVELPRGSWTDLRNNTNHPGRQKIANDLKAGLPIYAKSGSLIPLVSSHPGINLELHYFPEMGAEFFVYEPAVNDYSQFHAGPSADFIRVESESKVARTCEWILHHTAKPKSVGETGKPFREVTTLDALKPGTWFHDSTTGNLHVAVSTAPGEDHIVNIEPR
jgi:hypothetical protein